VIGDKVVIYQPRINQAYRTTRQKQAAKNGSLSFMTLGYNQAGAQLRERYHITLLGPETAEPLGTTVLELKPKQPTATDPRKIQVWVDDRSGLPVQYYLLDASGWTRVTLSGIQTNPNLPDSRFDIKVPGNVRWVEG
jgi:outer membrane lipoprotein-sorting protein